MLTTGILFCAVYLPYLLVALFVWFAFQKGMARRAQIQTLATGLGAGAIARVAVEGIRLFVHRPRPFIADPSIHALFVESSYSFPSGHASFFFALSTVVYMHNRKWGLFFFAVSTLIGIARVAAGVHYPSDIVGGAILGILVGWGCSRVLEKVMKQGILG